MARTQCVGIRQQLTSLISSRRLEILIPVPGTAQGTTGYDTPPRHGRYFANAVEAGLLHEALDPHLNRPGLLDQVRNGTSCILAKA